MGGWREAGEGVNHVGSLDFRLTLHQSYLHLSCWNFYNSIINLLIVILFSELRIF